ncbi:uncharacterized protein LOC131947104 [Physella acuta]|uniref:uncharacterized protein LOC131947104 n=1 Tax=Physella acuta TaxID=109671 RepID=UPI0027DC1381|nr:uncharacterized protein LOC131947104 [Physella acuta]
MFPGADYWTTQLLTCALTLWCSSGDVTPSYNGSKAGRSSIGCLNHFLGCQAVFNGVNQSDCRTMEESLNCFSQGDGGCDLIKEASRLTSPPTGSRPTSPGPSPSTAPSPSRGTPPLPQDTRQEHQSLLELVNDVAILKSEYQELCPTSNDVREVPDLWAVLAFIFVPLVYNLTCR